MLNKKQTNEFISFAAVGVFCTFIHGFVLLLLVELINTYPPSANALAFLCANVVSYILNSKFTFHKKIHLLGYFKYLIASTVAFVVTVSLSLILNYLMFDYKFVFIFTTISVPFVSFISVKLFGFRRMGEINNK
jgi:putative flippase GtrA